MARDSLGFGKPGTEDVVPCHLPVETGIKGLIRTCLGVPLLDELSKVAYFLGEQNIHIRRAGAPGFLFDLSSFQNATLLQTTGSTYSLEQRNGGGQVFWADPQQQQSLSWAGAAVPTTSRDHARPRVHSCHLGRRSPRHVLSATSRAALGTWLRTRGQMARGSRRPGRLHASHSDASQSRASPPQS